ncbi:MAG: RNA methyltransferase [Alicyclobacillaceae bacterium]|nr:RNA methyltransferase [Alicyclobacillaceae bacterium]
MAPREAEEFLRHLLDTGFLKEEERALWGMVRPERLKRMYEVVQRRTRYVAAVLEAVDDGHNQAAVLRTADALGVQDVFVITGQAPFEPSQGVTQGAHKWLTVQRKPDIRTAAAELKEAGYRVWASYLGEGAVPLDRMDLSQPVALIFGNEQAGVSEEAVGLADGRFYIPMQGFVQSFNISVAAAIALYEITSRARREAPDRYGLSEPEKRQLFRRWILASLNPRTRERILAELGHWEGADPSSAPV